MNLRNNLLIIACGFAALTSAEKFTQMDLYLLIGQSNMAGRGTVEALDKVAHPRVFTLNRANQWVLAIAPIHFDKKIAGVGIGRSFGIAMATQSPSAQIGLIPCAVGGTSITAWVPGAKHPKLPAHPYDDMLVRLKAAQKSGTLKGILWHQGESDDRRTSLYMARLSELIARLRAETGIPDLPFVAGLLEMDDSDGKEPRAINEIILELPHKVSHTAVASSEGLTTRDGTHFTSASLREFGKRFAQKMIQLINNKADNRRI